MEECVFSGKTSVLVNGSPTEEVVLKKRAMSRRPFGAFPFSHCIRGSWDIDG